MTGEETAEETNATRSMVVTTVTMTFPVWAMAVQFMAAHLETVSNFGETGHPEALTQSLSMGSGPAIKLMSVGVTTSVC